SGQFTRNPERVDASNGTVVPPTIAHHIHPVAQDRKRDLLRHVLTQTPGAQSLVFCRTKRGSDRVGDHLGRAGLTVAVIHGNKAQGARTRALADFKVGRVAVLVATDIAARGLDIKQLPLVVNYDLPLVAEDYVHRVGRTGRAGLAGRAVSLVSPADRELLRDIQRLVPATLETHVVEGFDGPSSDMQPPVAGPDAVRRTTARDRNRAGAHRVRGYPEAAGVRGSTRRTPPRSTERGASGSRRGSAAPHT